jgi:L-aspartate oxidase
VTVPPEPTRVAPGRVRTDVAIIGAGLAGLYAALHLPDELDVVVIDKGEAGRSGSSPWAQGGMAVALGPDDSPRLHAADTIRAGDGLCDAAAVAVLTAEAPATVDRLVSLGAVFDREPDGTLHLAREGGQTVGRSVHTADASGAEMVRVLRAAATPRVSRLPGTVFALPRDDEGRSAGVQVLHPDGTVVTVEARAVLLASGGCGGLFAATTNQPTATGDGVALAWRAGAAVRDCEFVQFHPTGLAVSGTWRFLLTEALRGAGATLHDDAGRRFMADVHPDAELAPRHIVARAILEQPGGAWLDATAIPVRTLEDEFPTVLAGARTHGFDLATQRVPVTPAAHYMVGGVRTDLHARTSVPGLYAAGEVASTGVHGANRMAGNSLAEALVFGRRAALAIAAELPPVHGSLPPPEAFAGASTADLATVRSRLQATMWTGAGPLRSAERLRRVLDDLDRLDTELGPPAADAGQLELGLAVTTARLIATGALARTETRGGHVRDDHPEPLATWGGIHIEQVRTA